MSHLLRSCLVGNHQRDTIFFLSLVVLIFPQTQRKLNNFSVQLFWDE